MFKKILFPAISCFLAYQSYKLISQSFEFPPERYSLIAVIALSIALNLFITGVFAFVGFAYPSNKILPNSYYNIKQPMLLTRIYNMLGVKYFKVFLLIAFWGKDKNRKKYFNGTKSGIQNFDFQTRQSEFGHLAAMVVIFVISVLYFLKGYILVFVWTTVFNILSNFYPIVLQRIHRLQIQRITRRYSS